MFFGQVWVGVLYCYTPKCGYFNLGYVYMNEKFSKQCFAFQVKARQFNLSVVKKI